MTKLTEDQIVQIRELHEKGSKMTELAKQFNVTTTTIRYWCDDDFREVVKFRTNESNKKAYLDGTSFWKKHPDKQREYMRNWLKKKYHEDAEFREQEKARSRRCTAKRLANRAEMKTGEDING